MTDRNLPDPSPKNVKLVFGLDDKQTSYPQNNLNSKYVHPNCSDILTGLWSRSTTPLKYSCRDEQREKVPKPAFVYVIRVIHLILAFKHIAGSC